jgi:hypothetical protein
MSSEWQVLLSDAEWQAFVPPLFARLAMNHYDDCSR